MCDEVFIVGVEYGTECICLSRSKDKVAPALVATKRKRSETEPVEVIEEFSNAPAVNVLDSGEEDRDPVKPELLCAKLENLSPEVEDREQSSNGDIWRNLPLCRNPVYKRYKHDQYAENENFLLKADTEKRSNALKDKSSPAVTAASLSDKVAIDFPQVATAVSPSDKVAIDLPRVATAASPSDKVAINLSQVATSVSQSDRVAVDFSHVAPAPTLSSNEQMKDCCAHGSTGCMQQQQQQQPRSQELVTMLSSKDQTVPSSDISLPPHPPLPVTTFESTHRTPKCWATCPNCSPNADRRYHLIDVRADSAEWELVTRSFTTVGFTVTDIKRIQNETLWQRLCYEKQLMLREKKDINEKLLYHTSSGSVAVICEEGLDQRLSRNGSFGSGIYFR